MKRFFLFISLIILILSCEKSSQTVESNIDETAEEIDDSFLDDALEEREEEIQDEIYIVKEDFVSRPFEYNPTLENLSVSLSQYEYTVDTIVDDVFSDSVTYYKLALMNSEFIFVQGYLNGLPANFLAGAKITDDEVELTGGVKIGMTKEEFYKIFQDDRIYLIDKIAVGDRDNNSVFEFYFDQEMLVEIKYMGYIG